MALWVGLVGCGPVEREHTRPMAETGGAPVVVEDPLRTVKVVVDDETSIPCAVRNTGEYKCWTGEAAAALPVDDYVQVQQGTMGLIGLTRDGRVVAPQRQPKHLDAPVIELSSTNMWGGRALCYRTEADGPLWIWNGDPEDVSPGLPVVPESLLRRKEGPFTQTRCVFEGLAYGVRPNGALWKLFEREDSGQDNAQVAASYHFVCVLKTDGSVQCQAGLREGPVPRFPAGAYADLAAANDFACAITTDKELVCVGSGLPFTTVPGHFSSVAAGGSVVCAIRVEGTSACFRRDADTEPGHAELQVYEPALDLDW